MTAPADQTAAPTEAAVQDSIDMAHQHAARGTVSGLRDHITLLLPIAAKDVDGWSRLSMDWYRAATRLDAIRYRLGRDIGPGLGPIDAQVHQLARDAEWLLDICRPHLS